MNATCFPGGCFCESLRSGLILQPANTFSCLAFVLAGLFIFFKYRNAPGPIYGAILTFIGLGSAYYHARLDFIGQTLDLAGMYLLVTFVILWSLFRLQIRSFAIYYILLNGALIWLIVALPALRRFVFIALLLTLIGVVLRRGLVRKDFYISLAMLVAGVVLWVLDLTKIWCAPTSLFQGHALWHIAGAIAAVFLFRALEPGPNLNE